MEENLKVGLVTMFCWNDYLSQISLWLLAVSVLTIIYFSIKRRYTQTSVIEQNTTEESEIYTSSENVFNESSSESLNLGLEKKNELLCQLDKMNESSEVLLPVSQLSKCIGTEDNPGRVLEDLLNYNELFYTTSKFDKSTETVYSDDEIQECNNFTKFQDVLDISKLNSESHSTINSWKSCNKDISHSESDYVIGLSSENLEISQPLNLYKKDNTNETETNKKKTFFTDRRHKKTKDKLTVNPENYSCSGSTEDEQSALKIWNKLKNEYILKNTKIHSLKYIGKLECSLENTEYGMKHENHLEISKISTKNHNALENEDNLDNREVFTINHDELESEGNLDYTEPSTKNHSVLENEGNLDNTLSIINHNELKNEGNLDNTHFSVNRNKLEDGYNLENIKYSLNEDELMLENNLETTEISAINRDESLYEYNLESPELSSLNNDKSISGTYSHIINCIHGYETRSITDLNSSSSSESTESLPSPIYQNNNSIDDIRYVEDYNDISFFDPSLSEDAMNQAFVED